MEFGFWTCSFDLSYKKLTHSFCFTHNNAFWEGIGFHHLFNSNGAGWDIRVYGNIGKISSRDGDKVTRPFM